MKNRIIRNIASSLSTPQQWLVDWFRGGPEAESGVNVDVHSALGLPPVWYAVSKIAGHVAQLPLNVHRRLERGSEIAESHPAQLLLNMRPNEYQTPIIFKEQLMVHALLNGNGKAAIVRRGGVPVEMIPMLPSCSYTCLVDGKKWHVVHCHDDDKLMTIPETMFDGAHKDGYFYKIPDDDVFHIPGLGYDGISGKSLVATAKDAIGLGLAGQRAASRVFKNGGRPGLVLESEPGVFRSDQDRKTFMKEFNEYHEGLDNVGRAALMREGMKATTLPISASDAEFIQQRQFQRQDMALLFLLEAILGDDASVSYNSQYEKNLAYLSNCLNKWLRKFEQESQYKLLGKRAQRGMFCKFDTADLLRSDLRTTIEAYSMAITSRILSPNEVRDRIGYNPYDEGDEFFNPAITPGSGAAPDDDPGSPGEPETPEDRNRLAIVSRLRHMLEVESNRARDAAHRQKSFMGWIDTWYAQWEARLCEVVEEFGGNADAAKKHCDQSRHELIEISGTVTQEGLPEAVAEVVETWPSRAEQFTDHVLGKEIANV